MAVSIARRGFLPLVLLLLMSGHADASETLKVTFLPHWIPQAQFAGYYCALKEGLYSQRNLEVTILNGGPKTPATSSMEKGTADFASLWLTNAIPMREKGISLVNITQLIHRSNLMLLARKSSHIEKPADMEGKKVGVWGGDFQIQPMAFFKKFNLNVQVIHQPYSINLFLDKGIDVTSAMWYNEYHTILNAGLNPEELQTFFFADYDLNFPEEGIYCSEKTLLEKPEACRDFVLATLEGWQYAFLHPEEAIQLVAAFSKDAKIPVNLPHQRWMLARMKDLMLPAGSNQFKTTLSEKDYQFVAEKLREYGLIRSIPPYESFYKTVHFNR
jgi:NitT/TauT family transport system substrate-binding protein